MNCNLCRNGVVIPVDRELVCDRCNLSHGPAPLTPADKLRIIDTITCISSKGLMEDTCLDSPCRDAVDDFLVECFRVLEHIELTFPYTRIVE
jgi:hypothetical protein